jgi:hypothetical protein
MKAAKRSFFCNAVAEQTSTIGSTGLLVDVSHYFVNHRLSDKPKQQKVSQGR